MLARLLNTSVTVLKQNVAWDGLGESVTAENAVAQFKGRIRQLTSVEQYQPQGSNEVATYRVYGNGSLSAYPDLAENCILNVNDLRYRVLSLNQGQSFEDRLFQIDCIRLTGV